MESPETVTVIDYEILYRNGVERRFRLRPSAGDTEVASDTHLHLTLAKGKVQITITRADLVEIARHELQEPVRRLPYEPKTPNERPNTAT